MRIIYSGLLYLLAPLVPLYLKKRGKKNPQYLENWHERFGWNLVNPSTKPIVWFHSVSVGETRAMYKLVELFNENLPEYQILITTMTPTGRETAKKLYPYAHIHYVPYDLSFSVQQFYKTFKPKLGIILETEIWPNLVHFAARNAIPLYLVNARLSNRSYIGYNRFKMVLASILNKFTGILCQDQNTLNNFAKLNYSGKLAVVGNTKFDLVLNSDINQLIMLFKQMFAERKVITFASTRDGEEELILDNLDFSEDVVYLIIPRHPERFTELENLLIERNVNYQKRSDGNLIKPETKVVIGDSMGEMLAYYAISYLAIIGGSFKDFGGQNPIEAIFMHVPVIFGNSMYNFNEIAENCLTDGCAYQIDSVSKLSDVIYKLLHNVNEYVELKDHCYLFINKYQGASQRVFDTVKQGL